MIEPAQNVAGGPEIRLQRGIKATKFSKIEKNVAKGAGIKLLMRRGNNVF